MNKQGNKALFMDLDYTIIRPKGLKKFPKDANDWRFTRRIIDAIRNYLNQNSDIRYIVIVTNQGGIEAGYYTEEEVRNRIVNVVTAMYDKLEKDFPNLIIGFTYSKTTKVDGTDRKPNPDMAIRSAKLYNLDLSECVMVGDASGGEDSWSDYDKKFAENANLKEYIDVKDFIDTYAPTTYQS